MTQEQKALEAAIAALYLTFASYQLPTRVEGCQCCVSAGDVEQIHRQPLQELTADDLSRYASKAMTTWGTTEDFKHFLPRLLELVTDKASIVYEIDAEVLFGKLAYANWRTWPQTEQVAVTQYLMSLWHYLLSQPPDMISVDEYLCGFGQAVDDLMPFLDIWENAKTDQALSHLLIFVDAQESLYKGKLTNAFWSNHRMQMQQVVDWLLHMGFA